MVKRIMIIGIALSAFQIIIYIIGIESTNRLYPYSERGVGWGIYTWYSLYWFIGLVAVTNILLATINNIKIVIPIAIVLLAAHLYQIYGPIESRPYRVLLRIIIAVSMTIFSFIAIYLLNRTKNNATQQ